MGTISPNLDPNKVKLGITPTLWWNDDFLPIDIGITFGQCVSEMALAGFHGCSIGHKYPTDPKVLKHELELRGLQASEPWVSTYFTISEMKEQTLKSFHQQMHFIKSLGGTDMVVAELGQAVHPLPVALFANRPIFNDHQWSALFEGLNHVGKIANDNGMRLCYHPHMGTGVMIKGDIDKLMANTDPNLVHLLLDTGHLAFAGADPLQVTTQYGPRIKHIHLKDVRAKIVSEAREKNFSFRDAIEAGVFTVPGDGDLDFVPILTALAKAEFDGWLVVEAEQDPAKAYPLVYAQKARNYLRQTLGW
jgi:inosose dehydratase